MEITNIKAEQISKMFLAGAMNLDSKKEWINELNVFPVPDGDTGTNMSMTIMSAAKEVAAIENPTMENLSKARARISLSFTLQLFSRIFNLSILSSKVSISDRFSEIRTFEESSFSIIIRLNPFIYLHIMKRELILQVIVFGCKIILS